MLPRRRYRLLLVVAAIVVFVFYHTANRQEWDGVDPDFGASRFEDSPPVKEGGYATGPPHEDEPAEPRPAQEPLVPPPAPPVEDGEVWHDAPTPEEPPAVKEPEGEVSVDTPAVAVGDSPPPIPVNVPEVTAAPDPAAAAAEPPATSTSSQVHWRSFPENFPLNEEDYILLPTGSPKPIPKIQFDFPPEAPEAKTKREGRLSEIRAEMARAWRGYRTFAWMHDELSPVTMAFRDPFCGWAATLVDGLDTLWITGLREEFDEAAKAVRNIDFTFTSGRYDIPVFETTIRYLGGLLAAYDVSGGEAGGYHMLLEKAEELAEILMGSFDTPNRMPVLYFQWRPEFVSQPRRATVVNVAELGTLLMEFTRLSQLTGRVKYYDAVARITDAFEALQERGTTLNGIFPESLDVSGCNRTATNLARQEAYAALVAESEEEVEPPPVMRNEDGSGLVEEATSFAGPSYPNSGASGEDEVSQVTESEEDETDDLEGGNDDLVRNGPEEAIGNGAVEGNLLKRGFHEQHAESVPAPQPPAINPWSTSAILDLDCIKQPPIVPAGNGYGSFSMGGSQDSTYEYFPKEYLLLGGLEEKYRGMHEKTVAAVKKWLLFRPMTPDGADILFSAKLTTAGHPEVDANRQFEVPHLTCFLGGMFALGSKIFGLEGDLEVARKLTDGCVWAYGATPSGIMPEGSTVAPCPDAECAWNETLWHQYLDPQWEYRDKQIEAYYANKDEIDKHLKMVETQAEVERLREQQALQGTSEASGGASEVVSEAEKPREKTLFEIEGIAGNTASADTAPATDANPPPATVDPKYRYPRPEPGSEAPAVVKRDVDPDWDYRQTAQEAIEEPSPEDIGADRAGVSLDTGTENPSSERDVPEWVRAAQGSPTTTTQSPEFNPQGSYSVPGQNAVGGEIGQIPLEDPNKPLTHEEYVKTRIENERIPRGFVRISSSRYILRPEAIESVWYMYRITGDPIWQEKGWEMWQSIIKAVRTDMGASALRDVLSPEPGHLDAMESFWVAETLKYFYLLFSEPDVVSLDEWVLNTEAHPFRRPDFDGVGVL